MATIFVLAPQPEFRVSLQFALEAEGHTVIARTGFQDPQGLPTVYDCAILDHHATRGHMSQALALMRSAPVILLANTQTHPLVAHSYQTVTKPFLGPFLSRAVASALRQPRHPE